jgi:hypothetical protein
LSCTGGVQSNADACNGVGTCTDAGSITCSPYGCGILTCKTTCTSTSDCAAGHTCAAPTCQ